MQITLKIRKLLLHCMAIVSIVYSVSAQAIIISVNDSIFGIGAITRDTDTDLEWLDITLTTNRSFNEVQTQFGSGGDFEGFRHAVRSEVLDFFEHAGVRQTGLDFASDIFPNSLSLVRLLGPTKILNQNVPQYIYEEIEGVYDSWPGEIIVNRVVLTARTVLKDGRFFLDGQGGVYSKNSNHSFLGNFLVREARVVPEPTTLALLNLGLAGLGFSRRRSATF